MEFALLRSLMKKDFYTDNRGAKCPDELFSKDGTKIKHVIDECMGKYKRDLSPSEVEAFFFAGNPALTSAQRSLYRTIFKGINDEAPMGDDVATDVMSKLFQQVVGEKVANLGFEYVNGGSASLEQLRALLDEYNEDFLPNITVDWENLDVDYLLERASEQCRWGFNIRTIAHHVEGVSGGHLIEVGARPNTGKTSSHASMICGVGGFAWQGAKVAVLCNEESVARVSSRYLTAATGMSMQQIRNDRKKATEQWAQVKQNLMFADGTGKDMHWVEAVTKSYKPDILVLDMGDKFASKGSHSREDQKLKDCAIHARQIAKEYDCAVFYMSQLSASAEGKVVVDQSMMEGSRTGKAAEADLMLLISKNPDIEGLGEEDPQRHITVAKNKVTGWHGRVTCEIDPDTARFTA